MKNDIHQQHIEKEEWRPVVGFEDLYKVSSLGRVVKVKFPSKGIGFVRNNGVEIEQGVLLSQHIMFGYAHVTISKDNKRKTIKVHRLVAQAFIPNPEGKLCVNHKDFDRKNNKLSNLEWCTHQENSEYNVSQGRVKSGSFSACSRLSHEDRAELIRRIKSQKESFTVLAKAYNISVPTVTNFKKKIKRENDFKLEKIKILEKIEEWVNDNKYVNEQFIPDLLSHLSEAKQLIINEK